MDRPLRQKFPENPNGSHLHGRWPAIGFLLVCVAFSAVPFTNSWRAQAANKDYALWFDIGQSVVRGEPLYPENPAETYDFMYPPTPAIFLFAPLSRLGSLSALAYLVYRRHWQVVFSTLAWLVLVLVVLPTPWRGFERNAHELILWYRGMLGDQSGKS